MVSRAQTLQLPVVLQNPLATKDGLVDVAAHCNIMAAFGISLAHELVPWLTLRLRQPSGAIVLGALIVGLTKLASCVVVRIVYGPNALAEVFMAAGWRTAKLMISLMWAGTLLVSALALVACHRRFTADHPRL